MNKDINKQLQTVIGNLIGKDYFKLEFGCKLLDTESKTEMMCFSHIDYGEDGEVLKVLIGEDIITYKNEDLEILGQEPTLNDVLLAIGDKTRLEIVGEKLIITIYDEYPDTTGKIINYNNIYYNLTKSIFNQSNETKLAIIKLLE